MVKSKNSSQKMETFYYAACTNIAQPLASCASVRLPCTCLENDYNTLSLCYIMKDTLESTFF